jgi:hypothetical protein
MELAELERATRVILDDSVAPFLVESDELKRLLNDAVSEACIRTRVIQDSSSASATIGIVAGQATYRLNKSIFAVRRVRLEGQTEPMRLIDTAELDHEQPGWDDASRAPGTPRYACFDHGTGTVRLVPTPAVDGVVRMLVWRGPTDSEVMAESDDEPALPVHMHRELVHWAAAQCFLNKDSEVLDERKAAEQFQLFEAAYGRKPDLHEIRLWSTNRRRRMRPCFD